MRSCSFKVVDFEHAAADGAPISMEGYIFENLLPAGQPYTARHDLHCVGELIRTWMGANRSTSSYPAADAEQALMIAFMHDLQRSDGCPISAFGALEHSWLSHVVDELRYGEI
jgi:hypothetical protein